MNSVVNTAPTHPNKTYPISRWNNNGIDIQKNQIIEESRNTRGRRIGGKDDVGMECRMRGNKTMEIRRMSENKERDVDPGKEYRGPS